MAFSKDLGDQINGNPEENVGGPGGGGSASSVVDDFNGFNLFHRFLGDGGVTKGGLEYKNKMFKLLMYLVLLVHKISGQCFYRKIILTYDRD